MNLQTRNRKANFVGQLGIRCVYCVPQLDRKDRVDRAYTYFTSTTKMYQTVRDVQHYHMISCPAVPPDVRRVFSGLNANMNRPRADKTRKMSPREWWNKCARDMGLVDRLDESRKMSPREWWNKCARDM